MLTDVLNADGVEVGTGKEGAEGVVRGEPEKVRF
jgi:hypothetical protein